MTNCETCGSPNSIGVACVPGVPYSAAYCQTCLRNNAHPEWIVRAQIIEVGCDPAAIVDWFLNEYTFALGVYMTVRDYMKFCPVTQAEIDKFNDAYCAAYESSMISQPTTPSL